MPPLQQAWGGFPHAERSPRPHRVPRQQAGQRATPAGSAAQRDVEPAQRAPRQKRLQTHSPRGWEVSSMGVAIPRRRWFLQHRPNCRTRRPRLRRMPHSGIRRRQHRSRRRTACRPWPAAGSLCPGGRRIGLARVLPGRSQAQRRRRGPPPTMTGVVQWRLSPPRPAPGCVAPAWSPQRAGPRCDLQRPVRSTAFATLAREAAAPLLPPVGASPQQPAGPTVQRVAGDQSAAVVRPSSASSQ